MFSSGKNVYLITPARQKQRLSTGVDISTQVDMVHASHHSSYRGCTSPVPSYSIETVAASYKLDGYRSLIKKREFYATSNW